MNKANFAIMAEKYVYLFHNLFLKFTSQNPGDKLRMGLVAIDTFLKALAGQVSQPAYISLHL